MGPTNIDLVNLFRADAALREAESRHEAAGRAVRVLERRIADLSEKLRLLTTQHREQQAKAGEMELDCKTRDAKIERFRTQQQNAKTHKEYQAFVAEINTEKVEKGKVEEELLKVMEQVEKSGAELKDLQAQLDGEQKKLEETKGQLAGRLAELQAEIDKLRPERDEAAAKLPAKAIEAFGRLAERFDGEALASISRPDRRREEYCCNACHMSLVMDVYNKLHTRDELVFCPSCRRILYIPEDMTPEHAITKPKERKERAKKVGPAAVSRQTSAIDIARSVNTEPSEDEPAGEMPGEAASAGGEPNDTASAQGEKQAAEG